ncbi:hypothetical protein DF052_00265 [Burkholderia glumae]|uniref:hypothetical protein n=1 Tax=Burkholderia glumae TaxID=337 RepID=UPI000F5F65DE|nr:hypothetical protein [Burkholderia glumae]RQZ76424.1 hypothetical protein DF052_00265 [Burkholderia glumae]
MNDTTSKPADGGPAFPVPGLQHDADFNGMTLSDYFAAKVLQGLMANEQFPPPRPIEQARTREEMADEIAAAAYRMADAMIKARG